MAAVGVHQGLSPVLDVVRDYRWGRVEETLGEDPYLVSQVGSAYVRGLEENGIIATLKHFAGYAASQAARNHAPVRMGPRELADVILPPFEHAVRHAGVRSVMNSYTDVDGVPVGLRRLAVDRGAAGPVGLHRHGRLRLRRGHLPADHAPDRRDRGGGRRVRPGCRARRRAAQAPCATGSHCWTSSPGRPGGGGAGRPLRPPGAVPEGGARAARSRLDPGGHRRARRARQSGQPGHRPAPCRGEHRPAGQRCSVSCRWTPQRRLGSPSSGRAPTTRRPSSAATPSRTTSSRSTRSSTVASASRPTRCWPPSAPSCRRPRSATFPVARSPAATTSGDPGRGRGGDVRRPRAAGRRRSRRALRRRHLRRRLRRRGSLPARTAASARRGGAGCRHPDRDDHGHRAPVRPRPVRRPAGRDRAGVLPR